MLSRILREAQQYQRTVSYEFRGPNKLGDKVHEAVMKATRGTSDPGRVRPVIDFDRPRPSARSAHR